VDLLGTGIFNKLASGPVNDRLIPYLPFYRNWERDKDEILNIEYEVSRGIDLSTPFVALVIRLRGAWPEKNMPKEFWTELIDIFYKANIRVFVFGKEAEVFCTTPNVVYVSTYKDWCNVVASPNLKHIGSTMTGAVYPSLVFGKSSTIITLIDNLDLMSVHGNDPSFYHSSINFAGCSVEFIRHIPTPREFFNVITKNL
jgi:hypothetical protein